MRVPAELPFAAAEYDRRLAAVRARMADADLDLLIVSSPENICYLSGYESVGYFAQQGLLVSTAAAPVLIVRALEVPNAEASCLCERIVGYRDHESGTAVIVDAVGALGVRAKRIGAEFRSRALTHAQFADFERQLPGAELIDSFGVVEGVRLVKGAAELDLIRQAGRIAEAGMRACLAAVHGGCREREVAAAAYQALIAAGSEWTGSPVFISSGPRSARAHTTWGDRIMHAGDPIFLEVNAARARYHAALMRPACIAPVPPRFRSMMEASRAGLEAALEAIRPGVTAAEIDAACRGVIARMGWEQSFRLRTGYSMGIGFENFHEGPLFSLHAGNNTPLAAGMVLHLVPYLSEAGFAGGAYSETVIVGSNGAEPVADLGRELVIAQDLV